MIYRYRLLSYRLKKWLLQRALQAAYENGDTDQIRRVATLLLRLEVEDKP